MDGKKVIIEIGPGGTTEDGQYSSQLRESEQIKVGMIRLDPIYLQQCLIPVALIVMVCRLQQTRIWMLASIATMDI